MCLNNDCFSEFTVDFTTPNQSRIQVSNLKNVSLFCPVMYSLCDCVPKCSKTWKLSSVGIQLDVDQLVAPGIDHVFRATRQGINIAWPVVHGLLYLD